MEHGSVGEDHPHPRLGKYDLLSVLARLNLSLIPLTLQIRVEGVIEVAEASSVKLSQEELDEIRYVISSAKIVGGRYNAHAELSLAR